MVSAWIGNKRFGALAALAFAYFLAAISGLALAQELNPYEVIDKMAQAELYQSYSGLKYAFDFSSPLPKMGQYTISRRMPDLEKEEYRSLSQNTYQVTVNDGKQIWYYIPLREIVIRRPAPSFEAKQTSIKKKIELVKENYAIKSRMVEGGTTGKSSLLVEFSYKYDANRPLRRVWVDPEKGAALRVELYGADNKLRHLSFFDKIDYNPAFDKNDFILKVPVNTRLEEVNEKIYRSLAEVRPAARFKVQAPKYLPKGFSLLSLQVRSLNQSQRVQLQFSDGFSVVSLFEAQASPTKSSKMSPSQGVEFKGNRAYLYTFGSMNLFWWQASQYNYAIVGDLEKDELLKIAESVE